MVILQVFSADATLDGGSSSGTTGVPDNLFLDEFHRDLEGGHSGQKKTLFRNGTDSTGGGSSEIGNARVLDLVKVDAPQSDIYIPASLVESVIAKDLFLDGKEVLRFKEVKVNTKQFFEIYLKDGRTLFFRDNK
jgi:hypothetical protein